MFLQGCCQIGVEPIDRLEAQMERTVDFGVNFKLFAFYSR